MPRIRTIKPEFWHDEKVGALKRDVRLLFIGLWNLADDDGACKSSPVYIKSSLFPYDNDLRIDSMIAWLRTLEEARMIIPFIFNNEGYYLIRTFSDHQVINRPSKTKWPDGFLQNIIKNTHTLLTEYSHQEGNGREQGTGKGKEVKTPIVFPFDSEEFLKKWNLWKDYKKSEHRFSYKTTISEQAALKKLGGLAGGDENKAFLIIEESMANGWNGLFELNENKNGKSKSGKHEYKTGITAATFSDYEKRHP